MDKVQLDLRGLWRFAMDEDDEGSGQHWEERVLPGRIYLPGCLQAQGHGEPISRETPWVQGLSDTLWYRREEYQYAQEERVCVPFLSQPPRHYTGKAWYQKSFTVTGEQAGCFGRLSLECTRWVTTLWLDEHKAGSVRSLCAPHVYELGALSAGTHTLTLCVDNGWQLPYRPDGHGVSDALGATWNGIGGRILLELLPAVSIDRIRAFPDITARTARLEVTVLNRLQTAVRGRIFAADANRTDIRAAGDAQVSFLPGTTVCSVVLQYPKDQGLWDEFEQHLVRSVVTLRCPDREEHTCEVCYGFCKAYTAGGRFYINGRPSYLRGTHFGGDYPLTGMPDCSDAFWDRIMQTVKAWGLNFIRCHSYCPPEAAFAAADRAGVYLQIECGMWNVFGPGNQMNDILWEETARILAAFGNHPSFLLLSPSNEPGGSWAEPLTEWVDKCRRADNRRLYTAQSGWNYPLPPAEIEGVDYVYFHRSGYGLEPGGTIRGYKGWKGADYRESLEGIRYPVICHELGQWCSYPDFGVIDKFSGYLYPGNFKVFRESAAAHGVLDKNREFVRCSGRQQVRMLKEDLEANLRTPHIYGFELLDLHDYLGQGTALVGVLDAFWDPKGYVTPEEWREFCAQTVILARITDYVIDGSRKDMQEIPVEVSHFGREPLKGVCLCWSLKKAEPQDGQPVLSGSLGMYDFSLEKNQPAGKIRLDLARIRPEGRYILEVTLSGEAVIAVNHWELWFSPAPQPDRQHTVTVTSSWKSAREALEQGGRVLLELPYENTSYDCPPVHFRPSFWNSQMGPTWGRGMGLLVQSSHPALAGFDTAVDGGWQWEQLVSRARGLRTEQLCGITNIVQPIDEWNRNNQMSLLLECRVGAGRLLMTSMDLEQDRRACPQAAVLKESLLSYMESEAFCPEGSCRSEELGLLAESNRVMEQYGVQARLEKDGDEGQCDIADCLDGNPDTFIRLESGYPYPLVLESSRPQRIKGILYMPRQNERNREGDLKDYRVEAWGRDGWQTVASGALPSSFAPKRILFSQTVNTHKLRFTALGGHVPPGSVKWRVKDGGWYLTEDKQSRECFSAAVISWILEEEEEAPGQSGTGQRMAESGARSATAEIDV